MSNNKSIQKTVVPTQNDAIKGITPPQLQSVVRPPAPPQSNHQFSHRPLIISNNHFRRVNRMNDLTDMTAAVQGDIAMERTRVTSSNLRDVGYSTEHSILEVGFRDGGVYQYFNVPESKYLALMQARSKGTYFDSKIKKTGYRFRKVR